MNMFHVATALNAGSRPADSAKKGKDSGEVSDDFKKLFQGKEESAGSTTEDEQVSQKDAPGKKEDDREPGGSREPSAEEVGKDEQNIWTAGLFAAYQVDHGFHAEMASVEPEGEAVVVDGMVPVSFTEEQPVQTQMQQVPVEAQPVKTEMPVADPVAVQEKPSEEKISVTEPESVLQSVEIPEVSGRASKPQVSAQEKEAPIEYSGAEQAVETPVQQPQQLEGKQEVKPQETVYVQVQQPEELPAKLTDHLLSKMADGVKEFTVQIEPENLGKIAVKISYENGQAHVQILCSEEKALDVLGQNVKEICSVIERNFGGTTTIIVEKPENDYLNQARDENGQGRQNDGQEQQKEGKQQQSEDDAEQFLQKLRLGLLG